MHVLVYGSYLTGLLLKQLRMRKSINSNKFQFKYVIPVAINMFEWITKSNWGGLKKLIGWGTFCFLQKIIQSFWLEKVACILGRKIPLPRVISFLDNLSWQDVSILVNSKYLGGISKIFHHSLFRITTSTKIILLKRSFNRCKPAKTGPFLSFRLSNAILQQEFFSWIVSCDKVASRCFRVMYFFVLFCCFLTPGPQLNFESEKLLSFSISNGFNWAFYQELFQIF